MALAAGRDESTFVNQQQVENDVATLYRAGPGKIGTVSTPQLCQAEIENSNADYAGRDSDLRHTIATLRRASPGALPIIPEQASNAIVKYVSRSRCRCHA